MNEVSIAVNNTSSRMMQIIVEFIHYVEEVSPASTFKVIYNSSRRIGPNPFSIDFTDDGIIIMLEPMPDNNGLLSLYLDDILQYELAY